MTPGLLQLPGPDVKSQKGTVDSTKESRLLEPLRDLQGALHHHERLITATGGMVPFFEAGTVGDDGIDVFQNEVKFSYGVGLRVLLERAAPFRVDFGWSKHGFNWSAGFGYTF